MTLRSTLTFIWTIGICAVAFLAAPWVTSANDMTVRIGFAPVWSTQYAASGAHPDWLVVMLACFVAFALPATLSRSGRGRYMPAYSQPAVQPVQTTSAVNRWGN